MKPGSVFGPGACVACCDGQASLVRPELVPSYEVRKLRAYRTYGYWYESAEPARVNVLPKGPLVLHLRATSTSTRTLDRQLFTFILVLVL
eukprot:scaffold676767_cov90-Prasinocladus_malaysianus.AAC.1